MKKLDLLVPMPDEIIGPDQSEKFMEGLHLAYKSYALRADKVVKG
jgi:hypothetical protein